MRSTASERRGGGRPGLGMIEILIAITVFSLGMLPILALTTGTSRLAWSESKHLVAGQLAAGLLDRLLALPFATCRDQALALALPRGVLADPGLASVARGLGTAATPGGGAGDDEADLTRLLRSFTVEVGLDEPGEAAERDQLFTVAVTVSWLVDESHAESRQRFTLAGIKYLEHP